MPCYHPLQAYQSVRAVSGKRSVYFNRRESSHALTPIGLPCGQCIGCRLERSRHWAVRCMHEASLYDENCFITLTYSDKYLPLHGSLDGPVVGVKPGAFALFMKRLRKEFASRVIRVYYAGEYGEQTGRPHYHACLFNLDFRDKVVWTTRGEYPVWRSPTLERLWKFGNSEIGSLTFDSAAYVARYITKKLTGSLAKQEYVRVDKDGVVYDVEPEFGRMSRNPGIGKPWLDKYMCEVYPEGSVVVRGHLSKAPRFYDTKFELADALGFAKLGELRRAHRNRAEESVERRAVNEAVTRSRLSTFSRKEL